MRDLQRLDVEGAWVGDWILLRRNALSTSEGSVRRNVACQVKTALHGRTQQRKQNSDDQRDKVRNSLPMYSPPGAATHVVV